MRSVTRVAVVDEAKCTACAICVWICPDEAITIEKREEKRQRISKIAVIDGQECLDCTLCVTRCPEYAITMVKRDAPLEIGTDVARVSEEAAARICHRAHMYPDQVICYCQRVQAKEVAAAILQGVNTPEDVSRTTGARSGCGTLCVTAILRLLHAAGVDLTKAPGYQWYDIKVSIWDIPLQVQQKYPEYYVAEDLREISRVFPGG
ncbi:MAG: (2Fe-2S)-binding protein [Acidobacteria bacterium]|nr:(2Fe-2S)-binding protein [Acidobacteriota bacterium]